MWLLLAEAERRETRDAHGDIVAHRGKYKLAMMQNLITRRGALAAISATGALSQIAEDKVWAHDAGVEGLLKRQTRDAGSRWHGGLPDADGLHSGGPAASLFHAFAIAYMMPGSKHHRSPELLDRMKLAVDFLKRHQSPDGNISLLVTNFNSPPDSAFATWGAAQAAFIARQKRFAEIEKLIEPVLRGMGAGMAKGGIHTPNHRWVVSSALAQIHALYPDPRYIQRIDEWLAEGIDIDADGQYTERSTVTYNGITNRAFTILALKLKRPELLDPVRKNLESMMYLLHPGNECVTDISRRQDQYTRGGMQNYALALRYLALKDGNGMYETLSRQFAPSLGDLIEYPELSAPGPAPRPVPDNYEKIFPVLETVRIRRRNASITIRLAGTDRFLSVRYGSAVIEAIRFASAFFGKAQFIPASGAKRGDSFVLEQQLLAPYWQPLKPARSVGTEEWEQARKDRKQTEICTLKCTATITEIRNGLRLRIQATGTDDVPLAVELGLREELAIDGAEKHARVAEAYLAAGSEVILKSGSDGIRVRGLSHDHKYVAVRGAAAKLPGPCLFSTGYTPFDQTIEFSWI